MIRIFFILLLSITLIGCQSKPRNTYQSQVSHTTKELKQTHGYWLPSLRRIYCITGHYAQTYDDKAGIVVESTYDNLVHDFKITDKKYIELIGSSTEKVGYNNIYILRYKSKNVHLKLRVVFREDEHINLEGFLEHTDKYYIEQGYERMAGELTAGRTVSKNPSICWGIK